MEKEAKRRREKRTEGKESRILLLNIKAVGK